MFMFLFTFNLARLAAHLCFFLVHASLSRIFLDVVTLVGEVESRSSEHMAQASDQVVVYIAL